MSDDIFFETTDEGFLVNSADWTEQIAQQLAQQSHIALTDLHWEIIHFTRSYYFQYQHLPNTRMFIKAISHALGKDKGNSRYMLRLFPESPLKLACKLAGLPKPPNCDLLTPSKTQG